ncbi:MAG: hypothetical protein ACFFHV_17390 [Promethearchaeota archaeon]
MVVLDFILILFYEYIFIDSITLILTALICSATILILTISYRDYFKEHILLCSYSFIFIILQWILYINFMIGDILSLTYYFYYPVFIILIPIVLIDHSLYIKKVGIVTKEETKCFIDILKKYFYLIFFIIFSISVYIFIGLVYYNFVDPIYINIGTGVFSLIALLYIIRNISFFKRHIPFSIYSIASMVLFLIEFIFGEFLFLLFYIFLLPLPVVGIIEFILFKRFQFAEIQRTSNYQEIPNLTNLIRNYVYHQLRSLRNEFRDIKYDDVDNRVKSQINTRIGDFRNYLRMEGYDLSSYEMSLLENDCFEESTPIRNEIKELIKSYVSRELFGEEIGGEYKTIEESIDALLNEYKDWELSKEGKKAT